MALGWREIAIHDRQQDGLRFCDCTRGGGPARRTQIADKFALSLHLKMFDWQSRAPALPHHTQGGFDSSRHGSGQ